MPDNLQAKIAPAELQGTPATTRALTSKDSSSSLDNNLHINTEYEPFIGTEIILIGSGLLIAGYHIGVKTSDIVNKKIKGLFADSYRD